MVHFRSCFFFCGNAVQLPAQRSCLSIRPPSAVEPVELIAVEDGRQRHAERIGELLVGLDRGRASADYLVHILAALAEPLCQLCTLDVFFIIKALIWMRFTLSIILICYCY